MKVLMKRSYENLRSWYSNTVWWWFQGDWPSGRTKPTTEREVPRASTVNPERRMNFRTRLVARLGRPRFHLKQASWKLFLSVPVSVPTGPPPVPRARSRRSDPALAMPMPSSRFSFRKLAKNIFSSLLVCRFYALARVCEIKAAFAANGPALSAPQAAGSM